MLISHECPISMLEDSRVFNDYDYALVHLFETNPEYYEFFKHSLYIGRNVILDNSIFELGESFDADRFAFWIDKLQPTDYIIPDALENSLQTQLNAIEWKKRYSNLPGNKIGVVQGKTYQELVDCYRCLDKQINVDKIAISFDYSYYLEVSKHPNKWMGYTIGRVQTLTRLLSDGYINTKKPHHLLGCSLPIEFMFYGEGFEWISSLDTSNPIVHGILNKRYADYGLDSKESIKLVNLINNVPLSFQREVIDYNITKFRSIVNKNV